MERRQLPTYAAQKANLPARRQLELELIEDSIAADPRGAAYRHNRSDGCVVDYSGDGLYVAFRVLAEGVVELVEFVDLLSPGR